MGIYQILRKLLFLLPEEYAHNIALWTIGNGFYPSPKRVGKQYKKLRIKVWDTDFSHPIGLAAGFDKNGVAVNGLLKQGFSFVEIGTTTPKPQAGNPKPRLFRLAEDKAIINRMGFNNNGADRLKETLEHNIKAGLIGVNIGKNKESADAISDYCYCMEQLYGLADYITINISSPNTPGLRDLHNKNELTNLLKAIINKRDQLVEGGKRKVPILLKISPDMKDVQLKQVTKTALKYKIDGMIVSNTTINRFDLKSANREEEGGLSGKPLLHSSTETLRKVYEYSEGKIPLIGVGGISSGDDAYAKIRAGASLLQIYSCLIYKGFGAIHEINSRLTKLLERDGFTTLSQAIGADHKN